MKNKKIITAFLALTFSILSLITPLACVSAKMDQATTYQESNRKENRRMSYSGTAVPNTGTVEKVYFNTSLSREEYLNIVSQLTLQDLSSFGFSIPSYISLSNEDSSKIMVINAEKIWVLNAVTNELDTFIYDFDSYDDVYYFAESEYDFNDSAISSFMGLPVGAENDKLTSLFSITPFEEETPLTLIETIGAGIANSAELFGAVLANAFTALASVFISNNELTLLGTVLVIAIGATVVSFAIKLILRLIQKIKV